MADNTTTTTITLFKSTGPDSFWLVDAVIREGKLIVHSTGSNGEWYIYVDKEDFPQLVRSLQDPDQAPVEDDGEVLLKLIMMKFSGRNGLLGEMKDFLDTAGISFKTDFWS